VFDIGNSTQQRGTEESGGLIQDKVVDLIKTNCGGTVNRVKLTEALLGVNSAVAGPAVTSTDTTPDSGLDNTSISDDSSVNSPVTSYTDTDTDTTSFTGLIWPIAGVIGLLGFMKLRGGKK